MVALGGEPGHIHWVVQPVTRARMREHGVHGPQGGVAPSADEVERIAERLRARFRNDGAACFAGRARPSGDAGDGRPQG